MLLDTEETEEASEEEEIDEDVVNEEGSRDPDLPPKAVDFPPSPIISTNTEAAGGTFTGPLYRCDGSIRCMEGWERNTWQIIHAIENGDIMLLRRRRQR